MEGADPLKIQQVRGFEGVSSTPATHAEQSEIATSAKAARLPETNSEEEVQVQEAAKERKVENIAKAMDEYVQSVQRDLKIQVHSATGDLMVKVISKEDGKTIREIPAEEVLNLAAKMDEMMGVLFNGNA